MDYEVLPPSGTWPEAWQKQVPAEAKIEATRDVNKALEAGWKGLDIAEIVSLAQIAHAHELVEHPVTPGRVIVSVGQ